MTLIVRVLKTIVFIAFYWISTSEVLNAQSRGFNQVSSGLIEKELVNSSSKTKTILSDFSQQKNMKMLNQTVQSKGVFYFMQQDKVRIEYQNPFKYILIMNNGRMLIDDGNKTNRVNAKSSRTLKSVNQIMLDCMRGTVFSNKDFSVTAYHSEKEYLLILNPEDVGMKNIFDKLEVYLDKKQLLVQRLVMVEKNQDNTTMTFTNHQINVPINSSLFTVR